MYVRFVKALEMPSMSLKEGEIYEVCESSYGRAEKNERIAVRFKDSFVCVYPGEYEIINNQPAALTSTTHVLKIEHKFKVTKTIDNAVQLELQHGVYSKDNVQELIDILVKVKEEM